MNRIVGSAHGSYAGGIDPVELTRDLIRCPSVTPVDAGALDVLQRALEAIGFTCHRLGGLPGPVCRFPFFSLSQP